MNVILPFVAIVLFTVTTGFSQIMDCPDGRNPITGKICANSIITITPFLNIPFNPQSASMGRAGIAVSPSTTSLSLNTSNLVFSDSKFGIQTTYVPWLHRLGVQDAYLLNTAGYGKIGKNGVIGLSSRYFNLGSIEVLNQDIGIRLMEWEGLLSYNQKLHPNLAVGLSLKYIYSRIAAGQTANGAWFTPINTIAGDLSLTYQKNLFESKDVTLITGLAIRNVGPKASYLEGATISDYLPANLGIGIGFIREFSEQHTLTITFDLNRLLVPTPRIEIGEGDPNLPDFMEKTAFQGMISSFRDAPTAAEDFNENQYSFGVEYQYNYFIGRIGHYNEHISKGGEKLITYGIGVRLKGVGIDFSYGSSVNQRRALEPWRISLSYDFASVEQDVVPEGI